MFTRTITTLLIICLVCLAIVAALAWSVRVPEPEPEIRDTRPVPVVRMVERFGG